MYGSHSVCEKNPSEEKMEGAVCIGCRAALHCKYRTAEITEDAFHYNALNSPSKDSKLQYPTPASSAWMWLYLERSGFFG